MISRSIFGLFQKLDMIWKPQFMVYLCMQKVCESHVYSQIYQTIKLTIIFWIFSKFGHDLETSVHGLFVYPKSRWIAHVLTDIFDHKVNYRTAATNIRTTMTFAISRSIFRLFQRLVFWVTSCNPKPQCKLSLIAACISINSFPSACTQYTYWWRYKNACGPKNPSRVPPKAKSPRVALITMIIAPRIHFQNELILILQVCAVTISFLLSPIRFLLQISFSSSLKGIFLLFSLISWSKRVHKLSLCPPP